MEIASNIKFCYGDNAFLVVHVSADYKEAFYRHAAARGVRLFADNVIWNDLEISTKWGNTLPMIVWNYLFLKTQVKQSFTHFQILQPSNLIIKGGLDTYVSNFDIVMRKPAPSREGWVWNEQANADPKYKVFCQMNGLGEFLCARTDGIAMRDEIFGDFVRRLLKIYSISDLQNLEVTYPQEETMLPTFLTGLKSFGYSFGDACARTFEPNEPPLDVAVVQRLIKEGQIAYLKRIAPQEEDPVRSYILGKFSYGRK